MPFNPGRYLEGQLEATRRRLNCGGSSAISAVEFRIRSEVRRTLTASVIALQRQVFPSSRPIDRIGSAPTIAQGKAMVNPSGTEATQTAQPQEELEFALEPSQFVSPCNVPEPSPTTITIRGETPQTYRFSYGVHIASFSSNKIIATVNPYKRPESRSSNTQKEVWGDSDATFILKSLVFNYETLRPFIEYKGALGIEDNRINNVYGITDFVIVRAHPQGLATSINEDGELVYPQIVTMSCIADKRTPN